MSIEDQAVAVVNRPKAGRKAGQESRAAEFRQRLVIWKQTPESSRPSLRALARELDTSHQLLEHYLDGLEEWQAVERYRMAKQRAQERARKIEACAAAEGREMTIRECCDVIITPGVLDQIEKLRQQAKRGPLHSAEFKILEIWAKHFPAAQELLDRRQEIGVKAKKPFAKIVKETPRLEGEAFQAWRDRILDAATKYETRVPDTTMLSERFLTKPDRAVLMQKIVERFEEIGGAILLDEGQVCYFIREESPLSRALVAKLAKYREDLRRILELNPGKVDFDKVKAEICQRFSSVLLSPLESHRGKRKSAGNSAGTRGEETGTHAFTISTLVS